MGSIYNVHAYSADINVWPSEMKLFGDFGLAKKALRKWIKDSPYSSAHGVIYQGANIIAEGHKTRSGRVYIR